MADRKPTHPGAVIREDILKPLGITVTEAAEHLGVTRKALSELINERAALSPLMAVRIAKATGTSAQSWVNMQAELDLWIASQIPLEMVSPFRNSATVRSRSGTIEDDYRTLPARKIASRSAK